MSAGSTVSAEAGAAALLAHAIVPRWPAPTGVGALSTTRTGGVSSGAWGLRGGEAGGLNLSASCGDDPAAVAQNRARLAQALGSMPVWLDQVHGAEVHRVRSAVCGQRVACADAAVTDVPGVVLAVLTADCLPVLMTDASGRVIAAAHAGWRGLLAGVLENTVAAVRALTAPDARIHAWLGPSIGPTAFEVGDEVRELFQAADVGSERAFRRGARARTWWFDLPLLARQRLQAMQVHPVHGAQRCTMQDADDFYSYRRDGMCGRMATLIWMRPR